jgi:hypothetical protein
LRQPKKKTPYKKIKSFKRRSSYKPSKKLGPTIGINKRKNIERDQELQKDLNSAPWRFQPRRNGDGI